MYKLRYLPVAIQDITDIMYYIQHELHNPIAAEKLMQGFFIATEKLCDFPYRNEIYKPLANLKHEYHKQVVGNYIMLYYVNEESKLVTIARVVYSARALKDV